MPYAYEEVTATSPTPTKTAPIVFTSPNLEGSRARGDWGGLIINGRAPINGCDAQPCEAEGEGGTGRYGGSDAADDSGTLRYVRVEFAGILLSEDNELNGIAFQGVGSGTEIDFIQVHMNKDDGVEFFGGTAQAKHLLLTGIGDDSLDWTDGWVGKAQFVAAVQFPDAGDQGIEADNNGDSNDALPRSKPLISNVTLVGSANADLGILLREGTAGLISNALVTGFGEGCLALDHAATFANALSGDLLSGELTFSNSLVFCPDSADFVEPELDPAPAVSVAGFAALNGVQSADPELTDIAGHDLRPGAGSPALGAGATPGDAFFDSVDYIGAFGSDDWTAGWTNWSPN